MNNTAQDKARQMAREFRIGITILALLFCVFFAVAFRRFHLSFTEPPASFPNWTADSAMAVPNAGPNPSLQPKRPFEYPEKDAAVEPARDEGDSGGSLFQPPPSVLPPPAELSMKSTPREVPAEIRSVSGGSFQPAPPPQDNALETEPSDPATSTYSGGSLLPAPSENPIDSPEGSVPATMELAPPNRTEPATFQQEPEQPATVQRTEFQANEVENVSRGSGTRLDTAVPLDLAIDGPSKPIDRSSRVETIRAGDSFWLISQRAYGTGNFFRALYEHNRRQFPQPDQLPVGATVEIPSAEFLRQRFPEFCPAAGKSESGAAEASSPGPQRVYTVIGGESLFDVARFQLGQGSRYVEILRLNRETLTENLESLPAGLQLRLPQR